MKNIVWITRDGHLSFLGKLSLKVMETDKDIKSYFVCHTNTEKERLKEEFNLDATVLQNYLIKKNNNESSVEIDRVRKLQEKYSFIPLRKLVWCETYEKKYPDSRVAFHLVAYFDFWEKYLTENKIDCVVSEFPAILSTNVLWTVCKERDIKFLAFTLTGVDERTYITTDWHGHIDGLDKMIKDVRIDCQSDNYKNALTYCEKMKNKPKKPVFYNTDLNTGKIIQIEKGELFVKPPKLFHGITVKKILNKLAEIKDGRWYLKSGILEGYKTWIVAKLRMFFHSKYYMFETNITVKNESYFLFALPMLFEWSLYCWAGLKYPHIIDTIREIAACLPLGNKLYVKEHTAYFPQKAFSFYREIKRIQNVRLVDRKENIFELIKKAHGVICTGGTVGWEAFLLGTPVITLADVWYSSFPGVYHTKNTDELLSILQNIDNVASASYEDKVKVVYCLFNLSVDVPLYPYPVLLLDHNIDKLSKFTQKWFENNINHIHETSCDNSPNSPF